MKNYLLLITTLLFLSLSSNAQKVRKKKNKDLELLTVDSQNKELAGEYYNKWSIEADFGQAKGSKPYTDGYYGNNPKRVFGGIPINHVGIGARRMFSPKFGLKTNFNWDNLQEQNGSGSLPFHLVHIQWSGEGVINLIRLFDIQNQAKHFGLLFHFGFQVSRMTPKMGPIQGHHEWNGGAIGGLSPQYRLYKNLSVFANFEINSNLRQHFNWDGMTYSEGKNNLTGSLSRFTLGLSVALGKGKIHGDWAIIKDKNDVRLDSLNNRIGEIEELMNDSDKDGVPDYLDAEQNSIAGVAVDTKGRMVDKNNNGVPDELEKYVNNSISNNNNVTTAAASENAILQLINEGYIAAYFDTNKSQPNSASTNNLGFILNYLRNNPTKSVEITGYADEIGSSDYNMKLASDRAQNVKTILMKAGISESRLNILSNGEDNSVDKNSEFARKLVRKAIFKIK
ncbi:OmpA family protein [Flavobacterium sp.]|uniref:OmpA family protein n=1 Tax=Flavobacterium sp. TaxID=239 RepID=UPI0025E8E05D|nr:OmpA family protein [Flavobacterium sp.]